MNKPTLRTITFYVIYDQLTKTIIGEIYRYKYQAPAQSKASRLVVVPCKGFYVPTPPDSNG